MNKLRNRIFRYGIEMNIGMGIAGWLLLYYLIPEYWFNWYIAIPLFFLAVEITMAGSLQAILKRKGKDKIINAYMLIRIVKLLITLIFVGIYAAYIKTELVVFTIVLLVFYFANLMLETFAMASYEKKRMNMDIKNQKDHAKWVRKN